MEAEEGARKREREEERTCPTCSSVLGSEDKQFYCGFAELHAKESCKTMCCSKCPKEFLPECTGCGLDCCATHVTRPWNHKDKLLCQNCTLRLAHREKRERETNREEGYELMASALVRKGRSAVDDHCHKTYGLEASREFMKRIAKEFATYQYIPPLAAVWHPESDESVEARQRLAAMAVVCMLEGYGEYSEFDVAAEVMPLMRRMYGREPTPERIAKLKACWEKPRYRGTVLALVNGHAYSPVFKELCAAWLENKGFASYPIVFKGGKWVGANYVLPLASAETGTAEKGEEAQ